MPSGNLEAGYPGSVPGVLKPKKHRAKWTDALAIEFNLPKW
jgi:hypothetical protein